MILEIRRNIAAIIISGLFSIFAMASVAGAADWSVKQVRLGALSSIQAKSTFESGVFPSVTVMIDPLGHQAEPNLLQRLIRPQLHAGAIISTTGEASQLYAGMNWQFDLTDRFYVNMGFGGAVHDGDLKDDGSSGPKLGSRFLFNEFVAFGFRLNDRLDVIASVHHSSNANITKVNDGISYAGLSLGYNF